MEVKKSKGIYTYYLLTTWFLDGGKSCSKIDMKKDKHGEPTLPYGPSLLIIFFADIYEQYFQTRLVDCIFRTSRVC
jgi:hypothetical protein